ncbi:MAG: glycosyltransferase family 39 protein [Deltaproteobacteria bacterium]|nr:glycosyltransferase family 39 protein [Deltaproteobacteria bacterium]
MVNILHNILGDSVWVMRLPALLAGILLIPATYLLFRKISNNFTALVSSTLVAVSSPLIEYSTNARGYSIVTFIFVISLLLIYYLSEKRNIFGWFVFIILSAIGFYTVTIYLMPFGIVILWYILIILFKKKSYVYLYDGGIAAIITILLAIIIYLPILIVYGSSVLLSNDVFVVLLFMSFVIGFGHMVVNNMWVFWNREVQLIIIYFITFGFIMMLAMIKYINKEMQALLISSVLWIVILLSIMRMYPLPRIWLFLIPVYLGLACVGLGYVVERITRHTLSIAIIVSIILLTAISSNIIMNNIIYNSDSGGQLMVDGEKITQYIKNNYRLKDDKVFVVNLTFLSQMMYYFKRYNLPLDHLLRYNSIENKEFVRNLKNLIVIEGGCDPIMSSLPNFYFPKEQKEKVLKDAKVNINDFQSCVLLKKFKVASLYLYQRE